jgi:inorganic phosphate transporter, PiT family
MTSLSSNDIASTPSEIARPKRDQPMGIKTILTFFAIMALGLFFTAYNIRKDLIAAGTPVTSYLPFLPMRVSS